MTRRVLASTTSHKREPLIETLDVYARLGLRDLDLNLHHFIEGGLTAVAAAAAVAANGQRVWVVSGGWCDFFHDQPRVRETFDSVARQVRLMQALDARMLRLFFGHFFPAAYDAHRADVIAGNLRALSDAHPAVAFVFENHDGTSRAPEVCREILERVDRPNIRMNFDPINFAKSGIDPEAARAALQPLVAHVHLKGLDGEHYCEFGAGDVDLTPILERLVREGYRGDFTVEYEGPFDGTLRLYESVKRARTVAASLD